MRMRKQAVVFVFPRAGSGLSIYGEPIGEVEGPYRSDLISS